MSEQYTVEIHTDYIQLDQALKLAGIIATGGQVKPLVEEGLVMVNGQACDEKRKKLYPQDVVALEGFGTLTILKEEA
ncbi:MAG: RNA-binding S4 domain-containing protein [Veillonella sp.]|nr:RNA-binding S4 domain-containing protein [Veillonella sp.]